MKVQRLQKMQLRKRTISLINQKTVMQLKGGTRQNSTGPGNFDDSAMISHCVDIQCY